MLIKAGIFDLDGVITDTAKIHFQAWKNMFDEFLKEYAAQNNETFLPFTDKDYLLYVDGKPRLDGIFSFLQARHITLSLGSDSDQTTEKTVYGLANKKQQFFLEIIERDGVPLFESTIAFINQLQKKNIQIGVVSSSKNCKLILEKSGIEDLFETRVDGINLGELGLAGKPEPDMFLEAVKRMHIDPQNAFVVEDALSGVQAGHAGQFKFVIGIDRKGTMKELFLKNGADLVVQDIGEINLFDLIA